MMDSIIKNNKNKNKNKNINKYMKLFYVISSIVIFIILWWVLSARYNFSLIFPSPLDTFNSLISLFKESNTYKVLGLTGFRIILSLLIGVIIGGALGILSGVYKRVEYFLYFIVSSLRCVPVASIIIIILIYFGNAKTPYIISFLMIFPIVYQGFLKSFKDTKKEYFETYILDSKFSVFILGKIYFPLMIEDIKSVIIQVAGLAIKVIIAAELICMTPNSIGKEIIFLKDDLNYSKVFAWTIILIIFALILERINLVKRKKRQLSS